MATHAGKDRVRAARLRKAKTKGALKPDDAAWLATYEQASTRATIRAAKKQHAAATAATAPTSAPRAVRGPQLQLGGVGGGRTGARVHKTIPVDERVDPTAHLWTPKVPPRAADAVPIPGMPLPPAEGTPLVDGAASTGQGDPAAAAQFATFVLFFFQLGIGAGRELADDMDMPAEVRAMLASDELATSAMQSVHASAQRLALKWGFKAVPMGDELIVAAAVVGSGALVVKNMKRKQLAAKKKPATDEKQPEAPTAPKSELDNLWGRS